MKTKAIYAGSFDPFHNGHLEVIKTAEKLFDEVIIAIGENTQKKGLLPIEIREKIIKVHYSNFSRTKCSIISFKDEYLGSVAEQYKCTAIVRGVRNATDCEYEMVSAEYTKNVTQIPIILIPTPLSLSMVSSTAIKVLLQYDGWVNQVRKYMPSDSFCEFEDYIISKIG